MGIEPTSEAWDDPIPLRLETEIGRLDSKAVSALLLSPHVVQTSQVMRGAVPRENFQQFGPPIHPWDIPSPPRVHVRENRERQITRE